MASASGVLWESFELVKKNYTKFLLLTLLMFVFVIVIVGVGALALILSLSSQPLSVLNFPLFIFLAVVIIGIIFFVEPIWIGSYYSMALQSLKGDVSLSYAIKQAKDKYVALLSTFAIEALVFIIIDTLIFSPLLPSLPSVLRSFSFNGGLSSPTTLLSGPLLSFFGLAILLVLIYMVVTAILAPLLFEAVPLVMLEGTSGTKAIKESIDIGRKRFWSILSLVILSSIFLILISFAGSIISTVVSLLNTIAGSLLNLIISFLISAFVVAWVSYLPVIFYRDYLGK